MSPTKCVQVLFLVLASFNTFCSAHRVLMDGNKNAEQPACVPPPLQAPMIGGSSGCGGGVTGGGFCGSAGPGCGNDQPWCGCGGSPLYGGCLNPPPPPPVNCPVGCQPAYGQPNVAQWAHSWPTNTMASSNGPLSESKNDKEKQDAQPNNKYGPVN